MSSGKVFVVADTHFGHAKVTTFRPWTTVEEHDRQLVERWNATVKSKDTVWHLGDVYFGGQDNHEILASLKGIKKLILGNHDIYPLPLYQKYFNRICGVLMYKDDVILSHIPVHTCQFPRFKHNIHGHLHANKLDDSRYTCVSVEHTDYRPILFSSILT